MSVGNSPSESNYDKALAEYHKGMTNLGRILFALAALTVLGMSAFAMVRLDPTRLAIAGGLAVCQIVLGIFSLQYHVWVNYVVMLWYTAVVILNLINLGSSAEQALNPGECILFFLAAALIYLTRTNLQAYQKATTEKARAEKPSSAPMTDAPDGPR